MSHLLKSSLLFVFLVISSTAVISQTCYVTKTGTKYHKSSCSYLKASKYSLDFSKAISRGYTACSRCEPTKANLGSQSSLRSSTVPQSSNRTTSTRCKGTTQSGNQCKRMTKSAGGYCYQHE